MKHMRRMICSSKRVAGYKEEEGEKQSVDSYMGTGSSGIQIMVMHGDIVVVSRVLHIRIVFGYRGVHQPAVSIVIIDDLHEERHGSPHVGVNSREP